MHKCFKADCNNETFGKYCSRSCSAIDRFTGNKFRLGKEHSKEVKLKIGKSRKGKKQSDECKINISNSLLGKKHSKERIAKHSKRMIGNKLGLGKPGWGYSNTKYKKGIPLTETHKNKLSISNSGKKRSEVTRRRLSEAASKREFTGSSYNNYFKVNGILCQGESEKKYIKNLISNNLVLPTRGKWIDTPYGRRLLDFEFEDRFIEIKSKWTYKLYINSDQLIKDKWITENVKKVEVIII